MFKINKNSITIAAYKRVQRYIRRLLRFISSGNLATGIAFIVFGLYVASFVVYGLHNIELASILLLTYIVIIAGCYISSLSNGCVAILVFVIPIFLCLLTLTNTYGSQDCKLNEGLKVEKRLQYDK